MSEDHTKEISYFGLFAGGIVGWGIVKIASISPGITERFPVLFQPLWKYFPPIGIIGAIFGAILASVISPPGRIRGSADGASVTVGIMVCLNNFPEKPNIMMIFMVSIAYGFLGFVAGSIISEIKSPGSKSD